MSDSTLCNAECAYLRSAPLRSALVRFALLASCVAPTIAAMTASTASADVPITLRQSWKGDVTFFATGTNLAASMLDTDSMIDTDIQPQSVLVRAPQDVPAGARLEQAFVYWAGTRAESTPVACANPDDDVELAIPNGASRLVVADECYCSDTGTSHDQWICRYDMTADLQAAGGQIDGTYTLGKARNADGSSPPGRFVFSANNNATEMASYSVVLVYRHTSVGVRHVLLYDGIWEMSENAVLASHQQVTLSLSGFEVDSPPAGDLTYYVGEGDGPTAGSEGVLVDGKPGTTAALALSDAVNSATNPFNRTINTVEPPRTGVIGVDIDQFDITSALDAGDTRVDVTYDASADKVWLLYNIIGIDVFEPLFSVKSYKTMTIQSDNDNNNVPSPGDKVRFTIHLENTGNAQGTVSVSDVMPAQVASWSVISAGGGVDQSTSTAAAITSIVVPVGGQVEVVIDAVLADVVDGTVMRNTANYSAPIEGGAGGAVWVEATIRHDGDGDGVFDNDDNCPLLANANQFDADSDDVGDLCDPCPTDNPDDTDNDGVCDANDVCAGFDDGLDTDNDGVPNGCEICVGGNDTADADHDGVPDACDVCDAGDDGLDADNDGVPDACDICAAGDDHLDADNDGVPNACDICAAGDDGLDADIDGVPNACDVCAAGDDGIDADGDGVPDACDSCTAGSDESDADNDSVPDACDVCAAGDDTVDNDADGVPDACDVCATGDDGPDADNDGVADACDRCAAGPDSEDADSDTVPDACDACPGFDDTVDANSDGVPDACSEEFCADGADNNHDGLVDCQDPLCASDQTCRSDEGDLFVPDATPPTGGTPADCGCAVRETTDGRGVAVMLLFGMGVVVAVRRRRRPRT